MNRVAIAVLWRWARRSICSTRSRIRARFGSPVSVSCVARNASSCWRLSRSVSALLRSCSKDSHIRTSVTFRLRLSIAYACSSVSGESCIRPAQSDVTSHAASHQRRQRLVTSLSGADRWAASWAKICQDSWPTSRATSAPSPDIQRATAVVDTAPTRAKRSSTPSSSRPPDSRVRLIIAATTSPVRSPRATPSWLSSSDFMIGCPPAFQRHRPPAVFPLSALHVGTAPSVIAIRSSSMTITPVLGHHYARGLFL